MPCRNLTSFFWAHKFGLVPWLFREHPETLTGKTGRPLGIAPQTIVTPKWGIFLIALADSIAQRQKPTLTIVSFSNKKRLSHDNFLSSFLFIFFLPTSPEQMKPGSKFFLRFAVIFLKRRYIFLILMQKKAYSIGKPDFRKRKTEDGMFFVRKWRLSHTEIF